MRPGTPPPLFLVFSSEEFFLKGIFEEGVEAPKYPSFSFLCRYMSFACSDLTCSFNSSIFRSFSIQALQYPIERRSEVFDQWIAEDIFEASIGFSGLVVLASAGSKAEIAPVGRFVTGTGKSPLGIDEGLKPYNPMCVDTLPVLRYPPGNLSQEVRRQVGDAHPGEDEEAGVDSDLMEIGDTLFFAPSQVLVSCAYMTGSASEADTGNRSFSGEDDVFEVFTDRAGKTKVVMFLYESVIEFFERGTTDRNK